jgi:hypothetical protein
MKPDNIYDEALFHLERMFKQMGDTPLREGEMLRVSMLTEWNIVRGALEKAKETEENLHRLLRLVS